MKKWSFQEISQICENSSRLCKEVMDDFLLYYIDGKEKISHSFNKKLAKYFHVLSDLPECWPLYSVSQYIAFRVFKPGGLIRKYKDDLQLQTINKEKQAYIALKEKYPCRFVLCKIIQEEHENYFLLYNYFDQEKIYVYSRSIKKITGEYDHVSMVFILITYNGVCFQTYGPIHYYLGLQPFDFIYFTKFFNSKAKSQDDVKKQIDLDPIPYLLLMNHANQPAISKFGCMFVKCISKFNNKVINIEGLSKNFKIEHSEEVYKFSLKRWSGSPHFAFIYYNRKNRAIRLEAATERGFDKLIQEAKNASLLFDSEPQYKASFIMIAAAKAIFKRNFFSNPYEELFETPRMLSSNEELHRVNLLTNELKSAFRCKREYNLNEMAMNLNIPIEEAIEVEKTITEIRQKYCQDIK